jgi:hypothetical protein
MIMKCFAVIRVDQDYDYVEGAECIAAFPTEQEANDLVQKMKDERDASWKQKMEYVEEFVDNINPPETDYQGWVEYLKQYPFGGRYVMPQNFKNHLKGYLRTHHYLVELDGYDPPSIILEWNNLFVVEIKGI